MKIQKKSENGKITIYLDGKLDSNTSPEFERELEEILRGERKNLVLDFSNLSYISSGGLRVLLSAQKRTNDVVGNLVITNVNEVIMDIFDMTGFSDFLTIENERTDDK